MTATDPQFTVTARRDSLTVQIANGAALSDAADLKGYSLGGIVMPAAWTAASITFQVSADGVTYQDLYDGSAEYTVTSAAASRTIGLPPGDLIDWRFLKARSGTGASPVNQGAARTLILILTPMIADGGN